MCTTTQRLGQHPVCLLLLNIWMRNTRHDLNLFFFFMFLTLPDILDEIYYLMTLWVSLLFLAVARCKSEGRADNLTISVSRQEMHSNYNLVLCFSTLRFAAPHLDFNIASVSISSSINTSSRGLSLLKSLMFKST